MRKLLALCGAALAVASMSVAALSPLAVGDDRDDAANDKAAAEAKIDDLESEVEGLDADLAQLYIDLETVRSQADAAQTDLEAAQAAEAAADREYQQAQDQLTAAEAERDRLKEDLTDASDQEEELSTAVGALARDRYRGSDPSALSLAMSAEGTGDIAERAASATTMARAQSQALDSVRESLTVIRSQADKQEATTERVTELEAEASDKLEAAEAARATVESLVAELSAKESDLKSKQAAWDKQKENAKSQIERWQKDRDAAAKRIAKIDKENREKQTTFSSQEASSSSVTTLSAGALFSSPLPGGVVTSNYGWRLHPIYGYMKLHDGTDWGASCGAAQYAVREGVVVASYYDSGGGNIVTINHGMIDGHSWTSEHLHLSSAAVTVGQHVDTSTIIGYTGTTGSSTGCHLHLTITKDGATVDPLDYM